MRSYIYGCRRYIAAAFAIILSLALVARIAAASNIAYYSLTFTYDQSSAREMLSPLNQWRTAENWYWNSDNTTQTEISAGKLGSLKWDYNLERIAMQRAYEIVLLAEHKRPNGESVFSITVNGVSSSAENIACGTLDSLDTYEKALEAWKENDCDYAGQGHRRNMLNSGFKAIGIAHVVVGNSHYWVQEFGYSVSTDNTDPGVNNSVNTVDVPFDMDMMGLLSYVTQAQYGKHYEANIGTKNPCPAVNVFMGKPEAMRLEYRSWDWGDNIQTIEYYGCFLGMRIDSGYDVTWSSSNENVVKIVDGTYYQAVGVGNCYITANISYQGMTTSSNIRIEVKPIAISSAGISVTVDPITYNGSSLTPNITVINNGLVLENGKDYTYYATDNVNAGYGKLTINGSGDYNGTREVKFPISAKDIDSQDITVTGITDMPYTGSAIRPAFTVLDGTTELVSGTDYTYDFSSNTVVGTATLTLNGMGNYSNMKFVAFRIYDPAAPTTPAASTTEASPTTGSAVPTGSESAPATGASSTTTAPATDTTAAAATTTAAAPTTGGAAPTTEAASTTPPADPSADPVLSLSVEPIVEQVYDGTAKEPAVRVTSGDTVLTEDDYSVAYSNNVNAGTATVFVSGKGIYSYLTPVTTTFTINPRSISRAVISQIPARVYTGSAIEPDIVIKYGTYDLVAGTDYTLVFEDNVDAGTATVTATGAGNYTGSIIAAFTINKKSPAITVNSIPDQQYTGSEIRPEVAVYDGNVLLDPSTDYDTSFSNNTEIGTATVTVTLKNNYEGSSTANFNIIARSLNSLELPSIADQQYTGEQIKPSFTLKNGSLTLVEGTDYTVAFNNNSVPGNAVIIVNGTGNYSGIATIGFKITPRSIAELEASSIEDQLYTGSAIKPSVSLMFNGNKLTAGSDYTAEYKNNTSAGTASVVLTGKGNFTGTRTIKFNIIKFSWQKISSKWYYIDNNGNKAKGFVLIDGKYYYFDTSTGAMLTKWQLIDGNWYYFASGGNALTGWQKISKKWYFFNSKGVMVTGLNKIDGKYYYFDNGGIMKTGWISTGGKWYYFASGGNALTGWQKISKKWYYFDKSTAVMVTGFNTIDNLVYYFDNGGVMKTKWQLISGKWYYFNSDGSMVAGTSKTISKKVYRFAADGHCLNP